MMTGLSCVRRSGFRFLVVLIILTTGLLFGSSVALGFENMSGEPGMYDEAGVLSEPDWESINRLIDDVHAAGAPVVVYLRVRDSSETQTVDDSRRLMEQWSVESAPGERDGIVIFLNLDSDDHNRGYLALTAGETHVAGGALPQSELDRIRNSMLDRLRSDDMAGGIVIGLQQIEQQLITGPPPQSAISRFVTRLSGGPASAINIGAMLITAALWFDGMRTWAAGAKAVRHGVTPVLQRPDRRRPAYAGALVLGYVDNIHIEATMLDLARRGALAIEPDPANDRRSQIRLTNPTISMNQFETALMEHLFNNSEDLVVRPESMPKLHRGYSSIKQLIRQDLQRQGLYNANRDRMENRLWIIGGVALLLAVLVVGALAVSDDSWLVLGLSLLGFTALVMPITGSSIRHTSEEGEREAADWRAYQRGLSRVSREPYGAVDLDDAFPYIVAMSMVETFEQHLKRAAEAGYFPQWMGIRQLDDRMPSRDYWLRYWRSFNRQVHPREFGSGGRSGRGGASRGSRSSSGRF